MTDPTPTESPSATLAYAVPARPRISAVPTMAVLGLLTAMQLIYAWTMVRRGSASGTEGFFGLFPLVLPGLYGFMLGMTLRWEFWRALPEAYRWTDPMRAIGYLIIPGLNLYWVFASTVHLTRGYAAFGRSSPELGIRDLTGWGLVFCAAPLAVSGFLVTVYARLIAPGMTLRAGGHGVIADRWFSTFWAMDALCVIALAVISAIFLLRMTRNANLARGCHG